MAAILLTGRPGSGKTTLVRRVLQSLQAPAGGFYTRETRDPDGRRTGFELVTLDAHDPATGDGQARLPDGQGQVATLAHISMKGAHRVGRYGVDIAALERVGVPAIEAAAASGHIVVIDEIGKMELLSAAFQRAVIEVIRHHRLLFGAIMQAPHPFADELKAQPDVLLFELTETNRDEVRSLVEAHLRAALGQLSV